MVFPAPKRGVGFPFFVVNQFCIKACRAPPRLVRRLSPVTKKNVLAGKLAGVEDLGGGVLFHPGSAGPLRSFLAFLRFFHPFFNFLPCFEPKHALRETGPPCPRRVIFPEGGLAREGGRSGGGR